MYFDIIYNEENNKVLQALAFNDRISASSTSDLHFVFNPFIARNIKARLLPWAKDIPIDVLQNPGAYKMVFKDGYSKPLSIQNTKTLEEFDLGLNTKINDGKIVWFGSFLDYISYSNITRELAFDLEDHGCDIRYYSTKPSGRVEIPEDIQNRYNNRKVTLEEAFIDDCLKIISYVPLSKVPHSAFNVAYTMLETFSISPYVINTLKSYPNEIWVPTNYTKEQFQKHLGDRPKIEVMPLWFDEEKFHPNPPKYDCHFDIVNTEGTFPEYPENYKFLCVSRYTKRKGFDIILKAFAEEFDRVKDDVSLVLFCRHILNVPDAKDKVYGDLRKMLSEYDQSKIPPIYIHSDPLPEEKTGHMYGWGDCHVMPSRGEGFGLTALEAAACKIPQILTCHTGLSDFVDNSVSLIIDTDEVDSCGTWEQDFKTGKPKYKGKYPDWVEYLTPFYNNAEFMVGGRPCVEQCKAHMRSMYDDSVKDIDEKVNRFYLRAHEKYTKKQCVPKIRKRVFDILHEHS